MEVLSLLVSFCPATPLQIIPYHPMLCSPALTHCWTPFRVCLLKLDCLFASITAMPADNKVSYSLIRPHCVAGRCDATLSLLARETPLLLQQRTPPERIPVTLPYSIAATQTKPQWTWGNSSEPVNQGRGRHRGPVSLCDISHVPRITLPRYINRNRLSFPVNRPST